MQGDFEEHAFFESIYYCAGCQGTRFRLRLSFSPGGMTRVVPFGMVTIRVPSG